MPTSRFNLNNISIIRHSVRLDTAMVCAASFVWWMWIVGLLILVLV